MSKDKSQNCENKEQQKSNDLRESFNKQITSNTSDVPNDIPPFTTGDGDSSGGETSQDTGSSQDSQSRE